ncbi:hypothetical protein D9M68_850530 [compost metagenome]
MLEHDAGGVIIDDGANDIWRHHHGQGQGIILDDKGNVVANGLNRLRIIGDDLIVSAQGGRRRNHDAGRAEVHYIARERAHGRKAGRRDAHDNRHAGPADDLAGDLQGFLGLKFGRFTHDAEDG